MIDVEKPEAARDDELARALRMLVGRLADDGSAERVIQAIRAEIRAEVVRALARDGGLAYE